MNKSSGFRPGHWSLHLLPPTDIEDTSIFCAAKSPEHSSLLVLDFGVQNGPFITTRNVYRRKGEKGYIDVQESFLRCSEALQILKVMSEGKTPILISELLAPFYDENVEFRVRKLFLKEILFHLRRLGNRAGLAVIIPSPPHSYHAYCLLGHLVHSAPRVVQYPTYPSDTRHMKLF